MSISDLRHLIEGAIPAWALLLPIALAFGLLFILRRMK